MFSRIFLLILAIFVPVVNFCVYAGRADSLYALLNKTRQDTQKVIILNEIASVYYESEPDSGIRYAMEGIRLSKEISYSRGLANAYNNLALCYEQKGDLAKASDYLFQALQEYEKVSYLSGVGRIYNNLGELFRMQGRNSEALEYYLRAARIRKDMGDTNMLAYSYNNIGIIHKNIEQPDSALFYYKMALPMFRQTNDKKGVSLVLNNLGVVSMKNRNWPEALGYYQESVAMNRELGDSVGVARGKYNIAIVFSAQGKFRESENYLLSSEKTFRSAKFLDGVKTVYMGLYYNAKNEENFEKANRYLEKMVDLKDSLLNEYSARQLAEMETRYETGKKEAQLKLLEKESQLQAAQINQNRVLLFSVSGGLGLMILLSVVTFRGYRQKKKSNDLLASRNMEINQQKVLLEERNKNITDSINYAKRIQHAVLPVEDEILRFFPDSFVFYKPKDIVSGDFYWTGSLAGSEEVFVSVADCTGHGVPGGFMSMLGISFLNEAVLEKKITDPAEILNMVRDRVMASLKQTGASGETQDGMDMSLVRICTRSKQLVYAAANNPVWLISGGELSELLPDKQPIGIYARKGEPFHQHTSDLKSGDMVYLFSDGFADQFGGPQGKKYKYSKLKNLLKEISVLPGEMQRNKLDQEFLDWKKDLEQVDDVCLMGLRIP